MSENANGAKQEKQVAPKIGYKLTKMVRSDVSLRDHDKCWKSPKAGQNKKPEKGQKSPKNRQNGQKWLRNDPKSSPKIAIYPICG